MAKGTKDCPWEYDELIFLGTEEDAEAVFRRWSEALSDNDDFKEGRVELELIGGCFIRVIYGWTSNTKVEVVTNGFEYGIRCIPRGKPAVMIFPADRERTGTVW